MFAGNLTYQVLSADAEAIMPHLFKGFDDSFSEKVGSGDVIIAGENFGCGSSREHPAVGLAHAGVKAVIVKSVNRIFYRSSVNQGLPIIVMPQVVDAYQAGDPVDISLERGVITVKGEEFKFAPLPAELMEIFSAKGLVNWAKAN
jgi:3-isopropylmalate dehydratase small subunit